MNCGGLHISDNCEVRMGCFSKTSLQVQTGINPEKACMRDHRFLTSIISECSSTGFQESEAKSLQKGAQEPLAKINKKICTSRIPLTLSNMQPRGLIEVTSTENRTEETYHLIKVR